MYTAAKQALDGSRLIVGRRLTGAAGTGLLAPVGRPPCPDPEHAMTTLLTESRPQQKPTPLGAPEVAAARSDKPERLVSLDAYRGFIMLAMASAGFGIPTVARELTRRGLGSPVWDFLAYQTDHVAWVGCSFWDLIQPSFMFMVGVALPYSYASRLMRGESQTRMFAHAVWRAFVLVLLAIFLSSPAWVTPHAPAQGLAAGVAGTLLGRHDPMTNFVFTNVLAQIGLGYVFVYLLVGRGLRVQLGVIATIFVGYTLFFGLYPAPGQGWFGHWDKNANAAHAFDVWFLNLFPRPERFYFNEGGYQTLNFVPSLITMILGLMAGEMLRGPRPAWDKLRVLVIAGAACLTLGWLAGQVVCPLVKRIWTPTWAVYSAGWTFLMLAAFYWVIDLRGRRGWAFPLVVVGMNSIAMYCMAQLMKPWVRDNLRWHLGKALFSGPYGPLAMSAGVLLVLWLVCLWLYRRKIFLRI
jgi:predicted acyltransferase